MIRCERGMQKFIKFPLSHFCLQWTLNHMSKMVTERDGPSRCQTHVSRGDAGIVAHWADMSSCHGISNIRQSKNIKWMIFWILVVLAGIGWLNFIIVLRRWIWGPLNQCFQVTPNADMDLDQHCLIQWLTSPSHYLNQCLFIIKSVLWHECSWT